MEQTAVKRLTTQGGGQLKPYPPSTDNLQPWLWPHPQLCGTSCSEPLPLHYNCLLVIVWCLLIIFWCHACHSDYVTHQLSHSPTLETVLLKSCQFMYQLRKIYWLKRPGYLFDYARNPVLRCHLSTLTLDPKLFSSPINSATNSSWQLHTSSNGSPIHQAIDTTPSKCSLGCTHIYIYIWALDMGNTLYIISYHNYLWCDMICSVKDGTIHHRDVTEWLCADQRDYCVPLATELTNDITGNSIQNNVQCAVLLWL